MIKCCATKTRRSKPTKLFAMPEKNNQELLKELHKLKQDEQVFQQKREDILKERDNQKRELIELFNSWNSESNANY